MYNLSYSIHDGRLSYSVSSRDQYAIIIVVIAYRPYTLPPMLAFMLDMLDIDYMVDSLEIDSPNRARRRTGFYI